MIWTRPAHLPSSHSPMSATPHHWPQNIPFQASILHNLAWRRSFRMPSIYLTLYGPPLVPSGWFWRGTVSALGLPCRQVLVPVSHCQLTFPLPCQGFETAFQCHISRISSLPCYRAHCRHSQRQEALRSWYPYLCFFSRPLRCIFT